MSSSFNRITVLGAGVLAAQISFQIAYSGFDVTTYDISDAALKQARQRFDGIAAAYPAEVAGATVPSRRPSSASGSPASSHPPCRAQTW
jgi:3-hydroxyacyl-CoA dehydrogenase